MKKVVRRNFAIVGVLVAAIVGIVWSTVFLIGAKAVSPNFKSHGVKVIQHTLNPGKYDSQTANFSCQTPVYVYRCYGPKQIQVAYGIKPLLDRKINGTGQTIVIIDAYQSPTLQQDLDTFSKTFGLPTTKVNIVAPDGLTSFNGSDQNQLGWAQEISLDVQWAHAVAPAAKITLVLAKDNQDTSIYRSMKYAIENNLGSVISMSFGEAESCADPALLVAQHQLFQQAQQKHITLIASSGDLGAAQGTCDGTSYFLSASTPASDPLVTAVGGTQLNADATTGKYGGEITWNERDLQAGSGGGYSSLYAQPSYQSGLLKSKQRAVPDVAYNAAINGGVLIAVSFLPGQTSTDFLIIGGTSSSAPQWAGIAALANQSAGKRLGFLNDALYRVGRSSAYGWTFHDISFGNNTFVTSDINNNQVVIEGYPATKKWDAATGWGSPNAANLIPQLIKA